MLLSSVVLLFGCTDPEIHEPTRPAKAVVLEPAKRAAFLGLAGTSLRTKAPRTLPSLAEPGRRTAINFWATDCPPCLLELPLLAALDRDGLGIAGISLDGPEVDVASALTARGVRYENLILENSVLKQAGLLLETGAPFTLILDEAGQIVEAFSGPMQRAQLEGALKGGR